MRSGVIKKYWFLSGLLLVFAISIADTTETVSGAGRWLKMHRGPDTVIVLVFFVSGLILNARQIRAGLMDVRGIVVSQVLIFLVAPAIAVIIGLLPMGTGILIGLFLVAAMPTTLSSGVVMTGAAGGNMAHALVITILSNGIAVFTIPVTLSLLLRRFGGTAPVHIDTPAIMIKLVLLVLLPLGAGLTIKFCTKTFMDRFAPKLQLLNQLFILVIVWMAVSQARQPIINGGSKIGMVFLLVFTFHGTLLSASGILTLFFGIGKGRRESVIFMGSQKTLPLSIILQVSLFPQYGLALVVCVMHHLVHLIMDGYLVGRLKGG